MLICTKMKDRIMNAEELLTCQKVKKTTIFTIANFSRGLKGASNSCVPR